MNTYQCNTCDGSLQPPRPWRGAFPSLQGPFRQTYPRKFLAFPSKGVPIACFSTGGSTYISLCSFFFLYEASLFFIHFTSPTLMEEMGSISMALFSDSSIVVWYFGGGRDLVFFTRIICLFWVRSSDGSTFSFPFRSLLFFRGGSGFIFDRRDSSSLILIHRRARAQWFSLLLFYQMLHIEHVGLDVLFSIILLYK